MDKFEAFLKNERENKWRTRALTDKSFKPIYQKKHKRQLAHRQVNTELATYGDAVLKLALCELLLDRVQQLSEIKSLFERDSALVIIGEHYGILDYLNFDKSDPNIPNDYDVRQPDDDDHKFIATAVEAVLGAIYKTHSDMREIVSIVRNFITIIVKGTIKKWYYRLGFPREMDKEFEHILQTHSVGACEACLSADTLDLDCEDGALNLLRVLYLCEEARRKHAARGIPAHVTEDTLRDIVYWTCVWSKLKGRLYLGELHWLVRHLKGELFALGRLQYHMSRAAQNIPQYGIGEGDRVLAVHIPRNGRLAPEAVSHSLDQAKEFFGRYFKSFSYKAFTCHSWLLDASLQKYLKSDSNILQFAARFDKIKQKPTDDIVRFVFGWGVTREHLSSIAPTSRFAETIRDAIMAGEVFYTVLGVIPI